MLNSLSWQKRSCWSSRFYSRSRDFFMQTVMVPVGVCDQIEQVMRRFIWGSTTNEPKVALVRWDSCCMPLQKGGIGLRRLLSQNVSYLMKLAYCFVTKVDALWVWVLRSKYKVLDVCPNRIVRTSCSFVWRSLAKV